MNFVDLDRVSLRYGEDADGTLALWGRNAARCYRRIRRSGGAVRVRQIHPYEGGYAWPPTAGAVIVSGRGNRPLEREAFQIPHRCLANDACQRHVPLDQKNRIAPGLARMGRLSAARDLLALVCLKGFKDHFPWQLSGGMQQRASLCRALIHDPSLLMLDEPFASLDMFTREELWLALQDLWLARKPTVILVTHDLREAVFLADRVLVMSARPGRIIAERVVNLPRPRNLDTTYEPYSVALVHELREHISAARSTAA
jgi:NitT/TauT family transport system ATP-binding protein